MFSDFFCCCCSCKAFYTVGTFTLGDQWKEQGQSSDRLSMHAGFLVDMIVPPIVHCGSYQINDLDGLKMHPICMMICLAGIDCYHFGVCWSHAQAYKFGVLSCSSYGKIRGREKGL